MTLHHAYAADRALRAWVIFRLAHPFNKELYIPTEGNITRWTYMAHEQIKIKRSIDSLPKITVDNGLLLSIRAIYGVREFDQFPGYTQAVYHGVARCFPGVQVYACGSRVRGDYVDANGVRDAERQVQIARSKAGMKHRQMSDYDFWVEPGAAEVCLLPDNTDRCRLRIPENEKVAIPIYKP